MFIMFEMWRTVEINHSVVPNLSNSIPLTVNLGIVALSYMKFIRKCGLEFMKRMSIDLNTFC